MFVAYNGSQRKWCSRLVFAASFCVSWKLSHFSTAHRTITIHATEKVGHFAICFSKATRCNCLPICTRCNGNGGKTRAQKENDERVFHAKHFLLAPIWFWNTFDRAISNSVRSSFGNSKWERNRMRSSNALVVCTSVRDHFNLIWFEIISRHCELPFAHCSFIPGTLYLHRLVVSIQLLTATSSLAFDIFICVFIECFRFCCRVHLTLDVAITLC